MTASLRGSLLGTKRRSRLVHAEVGRTSLNRARLFAGHKRVGAAAASLLASLAVVFGAQAQINNIPAPDPNCSVLSQAHLNGQRYPTNIEPEFPVWCYPQPEAQPP